PRRLFCRLSRSEFTDDLASTLGGEGLEDRETDAVADESHRAVQHLEVSPAGMIAPEMEVVVVVGQAGAKSELRRHEIVAIPFAVDVTEPAEEKAPIETLRDPALTHRERVRQTVGHMSEGRVAVAVKDAGAVCAGGPHDSQIAAAGDE